MDGPSPTPPDERARRTPDPMRTGPVRVEACLAAAARPVSGIIVLVVSGLVPYPRIRIDSMARPLAIGERPLDWVGSSKRDFPVFPEAVKDEMGITRSGMAGTGNKITRGSG